ncbi:MAG: response regulator, partial [Cyanobacteria bacterium J06598_3]
MTTSTPPPSQPANTVPTTLAANLAAEHPLLKSAPEDTAPEVSTKAITVMAVDDTPANLHLLIKMLTPQGYHIRPIPDGSSALASAAANPPDIILLDVQMPGLTGYEVCQRLKADERTCDIPVIFLTVLDDVADIVKGFEVGGVDYITKPVRAEELLARIKNQVALRSLQQQLSEKNKQQQKLLTQYEVTAIALRESEAKFSRAFQNTPLPTTIVDFQNEQYIDVNQAFIEHSGYSREEIIGHTAIELNIWQSLKQREIIFGQLKSQGYSHGVEVRFRTKSGGIKFAILFLTLVQFNDGVYILGAAQDMTQHKANQ